MLSDRTHVYENRHLYRWGRLYPYSKKSHIEFFARDDDSYGTSECGRTIIHRTTAVDKPLGVEDVCGSCARIVCQRAAKSDAEARA